jgi:hypothetical protein
MKLKAIVSCFGVELLHFGDDGESKGYINCFCDLVHLLRHMLHSDIGKFAKIDGGPGSWFCLYKKALLFRFINGVMDYAHLPHRERMVQELILYIRYEVTYKEVADTGYLIRELINVIADFRVLDGVVVLIQGKPTDDKPTISSVMESYAIDYGL